jgi:preprotein translocase subunit SecG
MWAATGGKAVFKFNVGYVLMGLFHFLIVVQGIIAAALVGVILMQRSEGGGLGGGSPAGLMSARGAADFLTRTTAILASAFVLLSISLAFVAAREGGPTVINETLKTTAPAKGDVAPVIAPTTTPAPAGDKAAAPTTKGTEVPLDK